MSEAGEAPAVGTRWRRIFSSSIFEVVDRRATAGCVPVRLVDRETGKASGARAEIPVSSWGRMMERVESEEG